MTPDPARRLADVGSRVLRIARPPAALPTSYRLPDAYESTLLDPIATLSNVCYGLLEWRPAAPVATRHGDRAGETKSLISSESLRRDEIPSATPVPAGPSPLGQGRPAMGAPPVSFLSEPGRVLDPPEEPAGVQVGGSTSPAQEYARPSGQPRRTASGSDTPVPLGRLDRYAGVRQTARQEPLGPDVPHPVERSSSGWYPSGSDGLCGEPSPEDRGNSRRQNRPERLGNGRSFPVIDEPADAERLATAKPISGMARSGSASGTFDAEGPVPAGETRLAKSAARLAALLRADATVAGAEEDLPEAAQDGAAFPVRSREEHAADAVDEVYRTGSDGRIDVEEIMERLADELETGFVRTYGSSGG